MISIDEILLLHKLSIERFGGSPGIRDEGLLISAVNRPYQTFDGLELYPTVHEKAAAIMESLIINHPFFDGNKIIGYLAMFSILFFEGYKFNATEEEAYEFTISVSTGKIRYAEMVLFLKSHTTAL